jgi:hypothetical protein
MSGNQVMRLPGRTTFTPHPAPSHPRTQAAGSMTGPLFPRWLLVGVSVGQFADMSAASRRGTRPVRSLGDRHLSTITSAPLTNARPLLLYKET